MATVIQRSSEDWLIQNPVLALNTIGYDKGTGEYRVGDGTTKWNQLAIAATTLNDAQTLVSDATASATYATITGADLTGAGSRHTALNALLAAAATSGAVAVKLKTGTYDVSGGHILVPADVTLDLGGSVLNGGVYTIVNDGTVANGRLGTGWTYGTSFTLAYTGSGVGILGGRVRNVSTTKAGTQLWPTRQQHNTLSRSTNRMRMTSTNRPTRVAILSDSMGFVGSGSGISWPDLIFNATYAAAEGTAYYVGNVFGGANISLTNLAIPGSTVDVDRPFVAWEQNGASTGDGLEGQALGLHTYDSGPTTLAQMDLVFLCQGHNGGGIEGQETIISWLRKSGVEVVIVTQNPNSTGDMAYMAYQWQLRRLAAAYGCAVADSYTLCEREFLSGRSTRAALVADGTHPTQAGWNLYATAIRDVFLDQTDGAPSSSALPTRRLYRNNFAATSPELWGSLQCMTVTPLVTSGTSLATPGETARNPLLGRRAALTNTATDIPAGAWAEFAIPDAFDVAVICEVQAVASTYKITTAAGATNLVASASVVASGGTTRTVQQFISSGTWGVAATSGDWQTLPFRSRPIRIEGLTGTTRVLAVVWSTVGRKYFSRDATSGQFVGPTFSGTWGVEAGPWYGLDNVAYTDVPGSKFVFEFLGDGFQCKINRSTSGGRVWLTVDGVVTGLNGGYWSTATDSIGILQQTGLPYGRHKVTIELRDAHPSAVAVVPGTRGARRLVLYELAALDSRMNAPDSELLRSAEIITS